MSFVYYTKLIKALSKIIGGSPLMIGPKWVKPSLKDFCKELENEDMDLGGALRQTGHDWKDLYVHSYVHKLTPEESKKIDISDSKLPPVEWLLDPEAKPNYECVRENDYRYTSQHHKNVLQAFREGTSLDMPIVKEGSNRFIAVGGRHRIAYAIVLGVPLEVLVIPIKAIKEMTPKKW
jgi:hypothetical protein